MRVNGTGRESRSSVHVIWSVAIPAEIIPSMKEHERSGSWQAGQRLSCTRP